MEYSYLLSKHYRDELVPKVMKYINTKKVRNMKARTVAAYDYLDKLVYGIE